MGSITCWQRLEPLARSGDMSDGLRAEIRDPLWLLARQWQVGEFAGIDAGSPVQASFRLRTASLTAYQNAPTFTAAGEPIGDLPLEVLVEREPVNLGLRAATQLGLRFENTLNQSGLRGVAQLIAEFRAAYPITAPDTSPAYDAVPDPAGLQYQTAVYGRVTDGLALYNDAKANLPNPPSQLPAAQPLFAQLLPILQAFVTYYDSLYSQPEGDSAWSPNPPTVSGASDVGWLDYQFAVGSDTDWADFGFSAPSYRGGHLDWYTFVETPAPPPPPRLPVITPPRPATGIPRILQRLRGQGPNPPAASPAPMQAIRLPQPPPSSSDYRTLMPTHVTFKGMPTGTFWTFEDGMTDFGQLSTNLVDLPTMLITEFSVLYGGDWFAVPVQQPFGSVSQIDLVVVTDTFAQRTLIRPTSEAQPSTAPQAGTAGVRPVAQPWQPGTFDQGQIVLYSGQLWWALTAVSSANNNTTVIPGSDYTVWAAWENPWTMFTITGEPTSSDLLLVPPTLGVVQDGQPLETVDFLRDDAAALGWALERTLQGALDIGVDAYEWYLQRIDTLTPLPSATQIPGGPTITYKLGTSIPDTWIPLVPEQTPDGLLLRRGALYRIDTTQHPPAPVPVTPHGQILEPDHPTPAPFFLADQAVPKAGLHIQRYFRRARWIDGSTYVWIARIVEPGSGPGQSGLAFDLIDPIPPPPAPTVKRLNPANGPSGGGTSVVITGTDLTTATAVRFGSTSSTAFQIDSDTQITATTPAGSDIVQVTITTPSGTSATSNHTQFSYQ
jgi:IPT/TIG domain